MSTHNIRFLQEIKKNIDTFWLKKSTLSRAMYNIIFHKNKIHSYNNKNIILLLPHTLSCETTDALLR